jgi:hypothetical protein
MPLKPNRAGCSSGTIQPTYACSTNNERASHQDLDAQTLELTIIHLKIYMGAAIMHIKHCFAQYAKVED